MKTLYSKINVIHLIVLRKQESQLQLYKSNYDTLSLYYSVARLLRLLTCYNPDKPVAIGERYGFRTWDNSHGYNYLTGGAGVVLSAPLVHRIIEPGVCNCPSATTPDDMYLFGACFLRLGYIHSQPVHSLLFHQVQLQRNIEVTVVDQ